MVVTLNMNKIDKTPYVQISYEHTPDFLEFIEKHVNIRDGQSHSQLQSNLIKHICQLRGQS
jgi:hypothetical protein